jgi:hypothetical protein
MTSWALSLPLTTTIHALVVIFADVAIIVDRLAKFNNGLMSLITLPPVSSKADRWIPAIPPKAPSVFPCAALIGVLTIPKPIPNKAWNKSRVI